MIMIRRNNIVFLFLILLSGCSLSPGMHMSSASSSESVFIESLDKEIKIQNISISQPQGEELYRIGNGDQIAITVWGLLTSFPLQILIPILIYEELIQMEIYIFHMLV